MCSMKKQGLRKDMSHAEGHKMSSQCNQDQNPVLFSLHHAQIREIQSLIHSLIHLFVHSSIRCSEALYQVSWNIKKEMCIHRPSHEGIQRSGGLGHKIQLAFYLLRQSIPPSFQPANLSNCPSLLPICVSIHSFICPTHPSIC